MGDFIIFSKHTKRLYRGERKLTSYAKAPAVTVLSGTVGIGESAAGMIGVAGLLCPVNYPFLAFKGYRRQWKHAFGLAGGLTLDGFVNLGIAGANLTGFAGAAPASWVIRAAMK